METPDYSGVSFVCFVFTCFVFYMFCFYMFCFLHVLFLHVLFLHVLFLHVFLHVLFFTYFVFWFAVLASNSFLFTTVYDFVIILFVLTGTDMAPVKRDIGSDIAISLK